MTACVRSDGAGGKGGNGSGCGTTSDGTRATLFSPLTPTPSPTYPLTYPHQNAWFKSFRDAKPGDPLYEKGVKKVADIVAEFDAELAAGTLPAVTWIVGPQSLSEHATAHPAAGEDLTARLLLALNAAIEAALMKIGENLDGAEVADVA